MVDEQFNKKAEEFLALAQKNNTNTIVEKRKIYHTNRQYIVKVPAAIMDAMEYKQGASLVFTLKVAKEGDIVKKSLNIEYES